MSGVDVAAGTPGATRSPPPIGTRLRAGARTHVGVCAGATILLALLLAAVVVGVLRPYTATQVAGAPLTGPSGAHWLGTDDLGRDVFVRVCVAARTSLAISVCAALLSMLVGTAIGMTAGLFKGRLDAVLMGFVDLLLAIPAILVAIVVVTVLSSSLTTLILVLAVLFVPQFARVVRSRCLELREREFVWSARVSGVHAVRIMLRHLLPNVSSLIVVQVANTASIVILAEAALSYLGLGVQPPTPSWGRMIFDSQNFMVQAPWPALAPVGALVLATVGWGLISEGVAQPRRGVR